MTPQGLARKRQLAWGTTILTAALPPCFMHSRGFVALTPLDLAIDVICISLAAVSLIAVFKLRGTRKNLLTGSRDADLRVCPWCGYIRLDPSLACPECGGANPRTTRAFLRASLRNPGTSWIDRCLDSYAFITSMVLGVTVAAFLLHGAVAGVVNWEAMLAVAAAAARSMAFLWLALGLLPALLAPWLRRTGQTTHSTARPPPGSQDEV